MAKRILWIFNHTSLRKFEVPMLINMGYEVFCPKKCNYLDFSTSISFEYDSSLSIPKCDLEKLNKINFYNKLSSENMELINKYFDIAICLLSLASLASLASLFKGAICLHVFGLQKPMNYTSVIGNSILTLLSSCGSRFWFLPSYDNLQEIECPFLQRRTIFMPIGIVDEYINSNWIGNDKRILFVCPKIKTNKYYENIYKNFCINFGDLPHVIGGAQLQKVNEDKTVIGFLPSHEYEENMKHLACMFYHSQEPYHLHYHPIEAIKKGMPVVFMAGGMLDHLGGIGLPGRATTINEARKKLKKLLNGDGRFIIQVRESQKILLKKFQIAYCHQYWENGMQRIEASLPAIREGNFDRNLKKKRIAIVMPNVYTGGVLDYSIRFALCLNKAIKEHHNCAEIVFAYPESEEFEKNNYFKKLKMENIKLRSFISEKKDQKWVSRAIRLAGFEAKYNLVSYSSEYIVLHDGAADFQDCDHIIFTADSDSMGLPYFCLKPFSVVVHDYIHRYVPEAVSSKMKEAKYINQISACNVLVTSMPTMNDVKQQGHIKENNIILTPLLLELNKIPNLNYNHVKDYFIWSTNTTPHKNHIRALQALEMYYHNGGTLDCWITGANTQYLEPGIDLSQAPVSLDYILKIHDIIRNSIYLKDHLRFMGNMPKDTYIQVLKEAKFVYHPGYGDNGNGTVMDAAGMGVPSLSSDYPAMRYLASFIGVPVHYVPPFDVDKIASALGNMENYCDEYAQQLPSRKELEKKEYINQTEELYCCIKQIIGL